MNLLLDSHSFVWMHEEPHKLSANVASEILNPANQIFLNAASAWELQIKIKLGKFSFSDTLENVIAKERQTNNLQILPVQLSHALYLEKSTASSQRPVRQITGFAGDCRKYDFGNSRSEICQISSEIIMVRIDSSISGR